MKTWRTYTFGHLLHDSSGPGDQKEVVGVQEPPLRRYLQPGRIHPNNPVPNSHGTSQDTRTCRRIPLGSEGEFSAGTSHPEHSGEVVRTSHFGISASLRVVITLPPRRNRRDTARPTSQGKLLDTLIQGRICTKKIHPLLRPSPTHTHTPDSTHDSWVESLVFQKGRLGLFLSVTRLSGMGPW